MFRDEKNLKDVQKDSVKDTFSMPTPYQAIGFGSGSYTKTNKLITALYMVTDIIDSDEPLRKKLRTLGVEIISDINTAPADTLDKIKGIMSFLDIALAMSIISEMNYNILQREFLALDQSIKQALGKTGGPRQEINLEEFLAEEINPYPTSPLRKGEAKEGVRLGIQKGSTLLKALSVKTPKSINHELKEQRRTDIINLIKSNNGSVTIKDIKDKIQLMSDSNNSLKTLGDKTIQRELTSLVRDGVLLKEGSKRWSKYLIKKG